MDLILSTLLIVAVMPLLILVAAFVRITMGAPVLFRQVRPGLHGRPFTLLKFRTMLDKRGPDDRLLPDDERLTRAGQFLRATSLDELPQLINVVYGHMSLVGPRPLLMEYLGRYTGEQWRRNLVRPGITGWAQVNGRNVLSWTERLLLDCWYVDNQSMCLDLKILVLTVQRVVSRHGISRPGHASMPEFRRTDSR